MTGLFIPHHRGRLLQIAKKSALCKTVHSFFYSPQGGRLGPPCMAYGLLQTADDQCQDRNDGDHIVHQANAVIGCFHSGSSSVLRLLSTLLQNAGTGTGAFISPAVSAPCGFGVCPVYRFISEKSSPIFCELLTIHVKIICTIFIRVSLCKWIRSLPGISFHAGDGILVCKTGHRQNESPIQGWSFHSIMEL